MIVAHCTAPADASTGSSTHRDVPEHHLPNIRNVPMELASNAYSPTPTKRSTLIFASSSGTDPLISMARRRRPPAASQGDVRPPTGDGPRAERRGIVGSSKQMCAIDSAAKLSGGGLRRRTMVYYLHENTILPGGDVDHGQTTGLRVLVVGASSGIGREVASQLATRGAYLLLNATFRIRPNAQRLSLTPFTSSAAWTPWFMWRASLA
jgi:hypothetical protein